MSGSGTRQLRQVVSGGQTGVDRAALDAALACGIPIGGWCPKGRRAEDGPIDERYPLRETPSDAYEPRTECNVRDAEGTLILAAGELTGGTALTRTLAERHGRPCLVVDPRRPDARTSILAWLAQSGIKVLNVAGPRESTAPGIYAASHALLVEIFAATAAPPVDDR